MAELRQNDDLKQLLDSAVDTFGKLDVLVNNASVATISSIKVQTLMEDYDSIMNLNVRSIVYLTHLSVEHKWSSLLVATKISINNCK